MVPRKNFSLLEIAIASVVFAIAILSTLAALSVNFRLQASNKETLIAVNAANEKLNLFLTDPLIFRKLNDSVVDLTPINSGDLTSPYDWSIASGNIRTAKFQVGGLNVQDGLTYAGSIALNCVGTPGLPPDGINYFEIVVVVQWSGVSGNRRVVLQGQRFRLREDSDIQLLPS